MPTEEGFGLQRAHTISNSCLMLHNLSPTSIDHFITMNYFFTLDQWPALELKFRAAAVQARAETFGRSPN